MNASNIANLPFLEFFNFQICLHVRAEGLRIRDKLKPIEAPIQIKHVHSSLSYQQATYQKYDRRGQESSSGYGA